MGLGSGAVLLVLETVVVYGERGGTATVVWRPKLTD
jgi:hypothetical protein